MVFIKPKFKTKSFTCPNCGVVAEQTWSKIFRIYYDDRKANGESIQMYYDLHATYNVARCKHCDDISIWQKEKMIFPITGNVAIPNEDMPVDVKEDYLEAKMVVNLSPRGSAALLRLALQKLCVHLGENGKDINTDIKNLVAKGLPESIQQALDSVRVIGNNAVHPGKIDLKDDVETAYKLFGFLNIICDILITQPRKIKEFYEMKIPQGAKDAINKRDGENK
ncbi:MAG: DUF4145 domain-containing protein [Bacteroidales bacterium]|nr:DUF4145 domain-containing protein [Bacteroidales bacterium]